MPAGPHDLNFFKLHIPILCRRMAAPTSGPGPHRIVDPAFFVKTAEDVEQEVTEVTESIYHGFSVYSVSSCSRTEIAAGGDLL
jgi:hypothetical protein